jgi:tRNA A-37 threonylcarbamoyl transferase component Bud32
MAEAELKTLGRYNIERTLGKGAMGVVYEGLDPKLNRRVAIKTILKSHLDPDTAKDYSMRFSREAQAVARLNHPHIVQVYDFAEEGDVAYLVMEFIRGKELKNFFDAAERFDIREAVRIMCELLDALDFAHNAGIIHRDIKPANVMLDSQARTKLTDFGVARVQDVDRTHAERTQAGTMVGTPAYMSPEQITGGNIDKRTDVFSAGIILYQFLTGEKPFTGGGAWTIAKKIIQEDPPLPSSLNNAVTPFFDAVVNKALSKNPDTRYQSAKDFGVALKRALQGQGEEDDSDKTVVGEMTAPPVARSAPQPRPTAAVSTGGTQTGTQASNQEVELEFWRAIKDGNDPDDFELYVQQFPTGIYAALAKRKIAKLRDAAPEETSADAKKQEKKEAEEAARKEADARAKLADEKEKLELELAKKEEEFQKREAAREAEAKARAEAQEKAKQEAAAEREKAKQEAAAERERAKQEAEKAKQEAAAELAKREAEYKKREAEVEAKRQAEAKARAETEAKAKAEAEAKAKQELAAERERARLETENAKKEAAAAAEKAKQEAAAERERAKQEAEKVRREAEEKAKKENEALAKKQAEERAKREAEFKKREAELKAQAAAGGKKTSPALIVGVAVAVLAIAGTGYYFFAPDDAAQKQKIAAMQKQLEEAKQQAEAAEKAKKSAEDARVALEKARKAEEEARKSGDLAKQKQLAEETARREAEAKKTADASKQRDAEAKKTADAAKAAQDKATAADRQAEQKAAAERAAAEKASAARLAQEKAAAEKAALERAAAAEKAAAERIAAAEKAAADAAARAAAAEKAAREKEKLASAAPSAPAGGESLFEQAAALEQQGKGNDAVKVYVKAARAGSGKAAKRLGEIYDKGIGGVSRDYAESLKWYNAARVLGEDVPMAKSR